MRSFVFKGADFGALTRAKVVGESALFVVAADVATLQDDVAGIDGSLSTAASVTVVSNAVTTAIDDLDELEELGS